MATGSNARECILVCAMVCLPQTLFTNKHSKVVLDDKTVRVYLQYTSSILQYTSDPLV